MWGINIAIRKRKEPHERSRKPWRRIKITIEAEYFYLMVFLIRSVKLLQVERYPRPGAGLFPDLFCLANQ